MIEIKAQALPQYLEAYRQLYSIVRVVYPEECRVVRLGPDGSISYEGKCYEVWRNPDRCLNCTSEHCILEQANQEKEVRFDDSYYHVTSIPIRVIDRQDEVLDFAIELININDVPDSRLGSAEEPLSVTSDPTYNSTHDHLTGIYNQEGFYEAVRTKLKSNPLVEFSMITTNIADFKFVNFIHGIETGNQILIAIAEKAKSVCALNENMVYGRLYADRFAFLVPKRLFDEAFYLRQVDEVERMITSDSYRMRMQTGIYQISDTNIPVSVMCGRATLALNALDNDEGRKICYFDDRMMTENINYRKISNEFPHALEAREFHMFLQPQVDAKGTLLGAEALCRWIRCDGTIVQPMDFIPVLEKSGLIYQLDLYMWEQAVQQLAIWRGTEFDHLYISVNISPVDAKYIDIYESIKGLCEKYSISPAKLKLEFTETALMEDVYKYVALISKFHSSGFEVEIDDFGSGYSSLGMLKDINADVLKIDMSFLRKTSNSKRGHVILDSVVNMSKNLDMPTISEGVETEEQLQFLTDIGCDAFQGYYFSAPIPIDKFEDKYHSGKDAEDAGTTPPIPLWQITNTQ